MHLKTFTLLFLGICLIFTAAFAVEDMITIKTLPNKGTFTLPGTIEKINNAHDFMLLDSSGHIRVKSKDDISAFKEGDQVTITGSLESGLLGLFGKDIRAERVSKDITVAQNVKKNSKKAKYKRL